MPKGVKKYDIGGPVGVGVGAGRGRASMPPGLANRPAVPSGGGSTPPGLGGSMPAGAGGLKKGGAVKKKHK